MKLFKKISSAFFITKKDRYFPSSKDYWQNRYILNGNSGAGSYGNLALFKSLILNDFVNNKRIETVIDFGCGDGNQLILASYNNYIGLDVSEKAIELCAEKFQKDSSKSFFIYHDFIKKTDINQAELTLSLDVIFHLLEDVVYEDYMRNLFKFSKKYVIIYSSDYDKFVGKHVRSRKFTSWIDKNLTGQFVLIDFVKNDYPFDERTPDTTSMSDFYIYKRL